MKQDMIVILDLGSSENTALAKKSVLSAYMMRFTLTILQRRAAEAA